MKKLTIGIPTYDDPIGLEFTLTNLTLYHDLSNVEILVCDNHPVAVDGKPTKETQTTINLVRGLGGRYISLASPTGTAPPRNLLFAEANTDIVLVMDSHVSLQTGAIERVIEYYDDPAHAKDHVCGPRLSKQLHNSEQRLTIAATHYADVWRSEMWGIWAQAWGCECGKFSFDISTIQPSSGEVQIVNGNIETAKKISPQCIFHKLELGREVVESCPSCGKQLPQISYIKHEPELEKLGFIRRGWSSIDTEPFEIPGLGLGMFAMRKEAWPGFPPEMQGFGGGELHLHELVRRNGGRAMCLPQAGWWHCFIRSNGKVPYRLTLWDKVRNYVIWRNHLDMSLDPVHQHFVADLGKLNDAQWDHLVADPIGHIDYPSALKSKPKKIVNPFEAVKVGKRDCASHADIVKELSAQCDTVVAFVKRQEWDVMVAEGSPAKYYSHNSESGPLRDAVMRDEYEFDNQDSLLCEPRECDMLLIDTQHTSARLSAELARHGSLVKRWIVLRGTKHFGYKDQSGPGGGLLTAASAWIEKHNQWHFTAHIDSQYGLSILSCNPKDIDIDQQPGTQLHRIFKSLGVEMAENCGCRARIKEMNQWGAKGCLLHRDEIVSQLKKDQDKYSWGSKFKAAYKAVTTGLAFKLDIRDPLASCYDEAVRRTEVYETSL